ncbi:hypothetical protein MBLNU459_g1363t1 [Dothideomycetes sp. NU459]
MPRPHAPPTPASSTDIRGEHKLVSLAPVLTLPPSAYTEPSDRTASSTPSAHGSDSSYRPASPASPVNTQRKQSLGSQSRALTNDDAFALPPPPTRSRKIIQMKPKGSQAPAALTDGAVEASASKGSAGAGGRKRGNNGGTTAQGRKIARKTAHSLIERRRRSKMNEEFGVLKDMIPACHGQEMHKLAILQASIDYLRYLEQCIGDLKAAASNENSSRQPAPHRPTAFPTSSAGHDFDEPMQQAADTDAEDQDEEMSEDDPASGAATPSTTSPVHSQHPLASAPSHTSLPPISHLTSRQPGISSGMASATTTAAAAAAAVDASRAHDVRHYSVSSASQASYSPYLHSQHASPFFGPSHAGSGPDSASFSLTSPALVPLDSAASSSSSSSSSRAQAAGGGGGGGGGADARRREHELDKEAMAALLMLNSDRRAWKDSSGRGMSVRDLLSN